MHLRLFAGVLVLVVASGSAIEAMAAPQPTGYYYCIAFESQTNVVWFSDLGEYETS